MEDVVVEDPVDGLVSDTPKIIGELVNDTLTLPVNADELSELNLYDYINARVRKLDLYLAH